MDNRSALDRIFMITEKMIIFDGLDDVFDHILKTAINLVNADGASIHTFDLVTGQLNLAKSYGISQQSLKPSLEIGEGISGQVVASGKYHTNNELGQLTHDELSRLVEHDGICNLICVPMKTRDRVIGCINVYRKENHHFDDHELLLLSIFAAEAVQAVEKTQLLQELKKQATQDSLTGFLNKASIHKQMELELARAKRHGTPLSVIFLDLDEFKQFNDNYSHLLGDKLLFDFANILNSCCRKIDILCRFGGDEFVIIAPQTDQAGAFALAKKIVQTVSHTTFQTNTPSKKATIQCSIGLSCFDHSEDGVPSVETMLAEADSALISSKKNGKNMITVYEAEKQIESLC